MSAPDPKLDRYRRQMRFASLGEEGQRRLMASRALVCGCGALGSVIADQLVRAGVGQVRIVDRDFLERDNLHRQVLFENATSPKSCPKRWPPPDDSGKSIPKLKSKPKSPT